MATQPQQTLTATNANSKHSALLADSASSATLPSPHLSHYQGGKLGCPSDLDGRDGISGHHITHPSVSHPNFSSSSSAFMSSSTSVVSFPLSLSSPLPSSPPSNHSQTPRPASRRTTRPCSLCGTSALRPQTTYLPTPAFGVLEQPIVLLHRLEDGLPRGDVRSLHAFGTIRLLPVQSTRGQADASDTSNDEITGHDDGESQIGLAMEDAIEGSTRKVLYNHSSTSEDENNVTYSDGETSNERLEESDTEAGVESVFLEESYPLEAIVESEVAVVSNHSDWNNKLHSRENGCGFKVHNIKNSDVNSYSIKDNEFRDTTDKRESVRDQYGKSDKKKKTNINHSSMNTKLTSHDCESEKEWVRNSLVTEAECVPSVLQQSCDKLKENLLNNNQLLSENNFSVPSAKCPSTLLTDFVSTTSVEALPGFISPSCTVPTSCLQTTLTTKSFAHQSSSSVVQSSSDSFVAYSPKMRHSPVSWSPHTASPNICESPALIYNYCPSPDIPSSPAPSPPSPCESPSLPFSPPPSPAHEFIQSDSADALDKGESQSFPLSPYSPGSSPSSPIYPALPLSPCGSPPSPSASADSLQTPLEDTYATPVEPNDIMEDTSEMRGLPCTPSESGDNCASSQHSLMMSDCSEVTTETNAQVEVQLGINDELKSTQIKSLESTGSDASLGSNESFVCVEYEKDVKSSLEDCSSSSEEKKPADAENDLNPMKLKVRIRSKTEASSPVQKCSIEECNKNGIPKIVLTLKGSGPNKEYSCSNKLRNDGQSSSNDDIIYRKHKSKKEKKERERHKVRNTPKRNKYKRHLELFGEDSNDSLKLESCDDNGIRKCDDNSRDPEKIKDAESPVLFSNLSKSDDKSDDEFFLPITKPHYSFSENIQILCEKVKQLSPEEKVVKEDSFSDYLPDLEPVPIPEDTDGVLKICKTRLHVKREVVQAKIPAFKKKEIKFKRSRAKIGVLAKKRLLMSKKKQRRSFLRNMHSKNDAKTLFKNKSNIKEQYEGGQAVSDSISNVNHSEVLVEPLPTRKSTAMFNTEIKISEPVPSEPSLTNQETLSKAIDNLSKDKDVKVQQIQERLSEVKKEIDTKCENDNSSLEKPEGSYLRARPERTTKKCGAGRDSDSCLWVSFGVNRPVPLPASDLPSLGSETEVERTVKLEYEDNSERTRTIHDSASPTPNLQQASVSTPQVDDGNNDMAKSARATSSSDIKNSVADLGNTLPIPSADQEAAQYFDEPLVKKAKYSKEGGIQTNNGVEEIKSGGTRENSPDLLPVNIAVKDNVMPHIRLRSAPRLTSKAMEESRGNLQPSDDMPKHAKVSRKDKDDDNQKLEGCNSSKSFLFTSGNSNNDDIKEDKPKNSDTGPLDSVEATISHELAAEDGQYYRPKKIQKVVDEIVQSLPRAKGQSDVLFPLATNFKKTTFNCYPLTEEKAIPSSASRDSSCEDEQKSLDEVISSTEIPTSASRNDKNKPESNLINCDGGNLADTDEIEENDNVVIPPPHDPEFDRVWAGRPRRKWKNRRRKQSAKSDIEDAVLPTDKTQETLTKDCPTSYKDPIASKNIKSTKKDKEATKKPRKSRKTDESGSGVGKTSAFEIIQQTFEVKHVEERGRRLAQEIKGFNWLEEKIKNSSLNRTGSSSSIGAAKRPPPPLLPQTQPVLAVAPPSLQSSTPPKPPIKFPSRRNSFTGCSTIGGLKGHLQTAVPPLLPSYRRTALPKRSRLSPPCSSVSESGGSVVMSTVASSSNSVENPSTSMGVSYGPVAVSETAAVLQETRPASLHSFPDSDRATLYSSTDSNTATLYGVSNPHLEVLFKDAETASDCLHKPNSDPSPRNISVSFQHLPSVPESKITGHCNSTAALARDGHGIGSRDRQCSTVVSNLNPRVSTGHPASSGSSITPSLPSPNTSQITDYRITHEPLTSAFTNTPRSESTREAAASDAIEIGSGSPQLSSSTMPSSIPVFSQKHILLKRAFMDMMKDTESLRETTQDANLKISPKDLPLEASQAVGTGEGSEDSSVVKTILSHVNQDEKDDTNREDEVQQLPKICEDPLKKDEKVLNAMSDNVKQTLMKSILKTDSTESETKSGGEMHSAILFSMLYEELQRTRQEVERLRKQQEMMLTEKSDKVDEMDVKDETFSKERPQSQKSSSAGNQSDDDLVEICEEKPAKISIRNDLLASNNQASIADRVSIQTTQVSTTGTVTCGNISPKPLVSIPDRQLISPLGRSSSMLSQMSPKPSQTSPCPSQMSPSLIRTSPVVNPLVSQVSHHLSYPAPVQATEVSTVQAILPLPHTSPTPSHMNVVSLYSSSGTLRASPVLPRHSPVISRQSPSSSSSPAVPKSSPALPKSSPVAPLCSPRGSKDNTLVNINSESLRSKYGINTEVEVMPVSTCGKPQFGEPRPQTYMEVIEYQKPQDTPLLLEAVKGQRTDSNNTINERETLFPQSSLAQHLIGDHVKRPMYSQAVDNEMKRGRFSTSDLPEFPPGSQKPPPPLKPVASLQRRYSDNIDVRKAEPIMVHFPPNSVSGFPSTSEHVNSALSFPQPRSNVTQNAILAPHIRRCIDGNSDRARDYQHQFNLQQQQYQGQVRPCPRPPELRSLGPDKATIFPIPAPSSSSSIQQFRKTHTPPTARGTVIEQHKVALLEHTSAGIFPKIKQNIQASFDSQVAAATNQERLQASSGPFEKTRQPQTFAARVLVRDSVPETVPRLPPPSYQSQHYSNCNPHLPNVMPNHHYLNNMHLSTGTNLQRIVTGGFIRGSLQPSSTNLLSHNSNSRINSSSGSSERKRCLNCPQPAKFLCSGCKKAWYCSENCQREHWAIHNTSCVS